MRFFIILISCFLIVSCQEKLEKRIQPPKPKNLIAKDEFIKTYIDIRVLETSIEKKINDNDVRRRVAKNSVDSLLKKKGLTQEAFMNSFKYYSLQPKMIYDIYDEMLNKINKKKMQMKTNKDTTKTSENQK